MSNAPFTTEQTSDTFISPAYDQPHVYRQIQEILAGVTQVISKVWPLKDYVAINPYSGIAGRSFADARAFLQVFSDCELLMPIQYYRSQYAKGRFTIDDVRQAIAESRQDGVSVPLSVDQVMDRNDRRRVGQVLLGTLRSIPIQLEQPLEGVAGLSSVAERGDS